MLSKVILTGYSESVTVDMNEGPRKASWWGHHLQNDIMVNMVLSSIRSERGSLIVNLRSHKVYGHPTGRLLSIAAVQCILSETTSYPFLLN